MTALHSYCILGVRIVYSRQWEQEHMRDEGYLRVT
jgi:hypothetical protein